MGLALLFVALPFGIIAGIIFATQAKKDRLSIYGIHVGLIIIAFVVSSGSKTDDSILFLGFMLGFGSIISLATMIIIVFVKDAITPNKIHNEKEKHGKALTFTSYGNTISDSESIEEKRIYQKVEKKINQNKAISRLNLMANINTESLTKINGTVYTGVHIFTNQMLNKEFRLTRNYIFTADLDSIVKVVEVKEEVKSEGEWVEMRM